MSRRDLPLVEIAYLLRHLPAEAVLSGNGGWSIGDFLKSDLIHVHTGHPHPADPRAIREAEAKRAALAEGAKRSAERRRRLGIKGSVFRRKKE